MSEDTACFNSSTLLFQTYNFYGLGIESVTRVKQAVSRVILEGLYKIT